ncbi:MAG TPA: hypothetical protein VF234_04630, partial [Limnochordia bacterium]
MGRRRAAPRTDRRLTVFAWVAVALSALWLAYSPGSRRVQGPVTPADPLVAGEPLWRVAHRVSNTFGEASPRGITYLFTRDPESGEPIINVQMAGAFDNPLTAGSDEPVDRLVFNVLVESGRVVE